MNFSSDTENWQSIQNQIGILGNSAAIRQMIETIAQVAPTDISVLITGESGTGKELAAQAVHTLSRRHGYPLITVNCAAIPEGILESELFGHEKGSFTGAVGPRKGYFELADKGSIFLDEIGELPLSIQVKLLRILELREFMRVGGSVTQQVDVRFIAATNKNLEDEVERGAFRQDLFYRLNAMHIHVPSLYERKQDIPILANKFAEDFCRDNHIEFNGFTQDALYALSDYRWPGNVRELRNITEKMIVLERGQRIDSQIVGKYLPPARMHGSTTLPLPLLKPKEELEQEFLLRALLEIKSEIAQLREIILTSQLPKKSLGPWRQEVPIEYNHTFDETVEEDGVPESVAEMEKEMIKQTLAKTGGNKRKTAKILGLSERTLYRKLKRYDL
ncbi:sigma-54-dependent Fis family transcriptional regulator [candidate division KSB1 bacterium]|nr:sigma-54-dependent Fis family transcriptional regulator [candidate division KSB1 bacterium]